MVFGINKKMANIAKGLTLLQEIYSLYEDLKEDGTMNEVLEAVAALEAAYEKNPKIKELMQKLSDFKLQEK